MLTLQIYFSHKNMSDIEISRLAFENQSKARRVLQASALYVACHATQCSSV